MATAGRGPRRRRDGRGAAVRAAPLRAGTRPTCRHRAAARAGRRAARSATASRSSATPRPRRRADTLVLVVKPQDMGGAARRDRARVLRPGTLVVSLAAGITTDVHRGAAARRARRSSGSCPTPRRSSTRGWRRSRPGRTATRSTSPRPRRCSAPSARSSGSRRSSRTRSPRSAAPGPAYIFYRRRGDDRGGRPASGCRGRPSTELVVQTLVGAAKMLSETGEHPTVLRENVTSPAGTTAAALRAARGPQGAGGVPVGHGGRARPVSRAGRPATEPQPARGT